MEQLDSHWTAFHEIWYSNVFFFGNMPRKFKLHKNMTITGTLHEYLCTFMIISRCILIRIRYVSDESCGGNQNTLIMFNNLFFWKSCRFWDNVEKCCRAGEAIDDHITRRMRFPCWITKAITTHSEYVILIAFTWQKWLRKRTQYYFIRAWRVLFSFLARVLV